MDNANKAITILLDHIKYIKNNELSQNELATLHITCLKDLRKIYDINLLLNHMMHVIRYKYNTYDSLQLYRNE